MPGAQTVTEDANLVFNTTNSNRISIADPENNNQTVTISSTNGTFTLSTLSGLSGSGNGTGALAYSGTLTNINAALNNAYYLGNLNYNGSAAVSVSTDDGNGGTDSKTINISVTPDNDHPVLAAIEATSLSYTEGTGAVQVTNTITVADVDNTTLTSATIAISSYYQNGQDVLSFTPAYGITGSFVAALGRINLSGAASLANYQTVLKSVRYENTSANPSTVNRTVTFQVNDGTANSNTQSRIVTVTPVNNLPVLAGIEVTTLSYTENDPATQITNSITVTDADDVNLESAVIAIFANYQNGEDVLSFTNDNGISGSWSAANGTMTLTGTSSVTNYQAALKNVLYTNTSENPETTARTISFTVNDGDGSGVAVTRSLSIEAVNDLPYATDVIVHILTTLQVASNVEGKFTYNDYENNPAGTHIYQWYRADNASGVGAAVISGATNNTYTLTQQDGGKYIAVEITPVQTNPAAQGIAVRSAWVGPVGQDNQPTAAISGGGIICPQGDAAAISITLTGVPPWSVTLRRSNSSPSNNKDSLIANITTSPRTFQANISGDYSLVDVADQIYTTPLTTKVSGLATVQHIAAPLAALSGTALVCPNDSAVLQVNFEGVAPWTIKYTLNDANEKTVSNIIQPTYNLKVKGAGTYRLTSVTHGADIGCASGTGQVNHRTVPTATLTGPGTVCENAQATLSVALTGSAPWMIKYARDGVVQDSIMNISTSPRNIQVMPLYRTTPYEYTLTEIRDQFCKSAGSGTVNLAIDKAPETDIYGLKATYSITNIKADTAFGSPAGGYFTGPALVNISDSSTIFLPYIAEVGKHNITYSYQGGNMCWGRDTAKVTIINVNADMFFPGSPERKIFCRNDRPFTVTGANIANDTGSFSISPGMGLVDNGNNTATIYPQQLAGGVYEITYRYFDQIPLSISESFNMGASPDAAYTWNTECYHEGAPIDFSDQSTTNNFGSIADYTWKFYHGEQLDSLKGENVSYEFESAGTYKVTLQITTNYGCTDSATEEFPLRPTIKPLEESYYEDFELGANGWVTLKGTNSETNSWKFGEPPAGFNGAASGLNAWYTQVTPGLLEQSWVTSPCFDFTGATKPMIKFSVKRNFDQHRDGAVIQYTENNGTDWINLGKFEDGVNWFNDYDIQGNPGGQSIGWSNGKDNSWTEVRHHLDELIGKTDIQFRIAYGSTKLASDNLGVAFDNIWIGRRNKLVMLEHFTNVSDDACKEADTIVRTETMVYPADVINVQYHTSFPGYDPFNDDNPVIPGARIFAYGVNQVPYSVMDGGAVVSHNYDYTSNELTAGDIIIESLYDPLFTISVASEYNTGSVGVNVTLTALKAIPMKELTLHIIVMEREITGVEQLGADKIFRNVVKDMLPNAAGTLINISWSPGSQEELSYSWIYKNVYNPDELRIVAFVQDVLTREIYQASIDKSDFINSTDDNTDPLQELSFGIYPNPAQDYAIVVHNGQLVTPHTLEIYSISGSLVKSAKIEAGTTETILDLYDLEHGFYFVRISDPKGIQSILKLIKK